MTRLKSVVEYDGTNYRGWQIQPGKPTIQAAVTDAWSKIEGRPVIIHAAGRTDAGVHAEGQTIHCDILKVLPPERRLLALNGLLPPDIRVRSVEPCPPEFHARFSAKSKIYLYRIWRGRVVSPFWFRYVHQVPVELDREAMRATAADLVGTHDFAPFSVSSSEVESSVRTLASVEFIDETPDILALRFTGDGFLRYMVRRMAGTLLDVGRGRHPVSVVGDVFRGEVSPQLLTAPAKGLTLIRVDY